MSGRGHQMDFYILGGSVQWSSTTLTLSRLGLACHDNNRASRHSKNYHKQGLEGRSLSVCPVLWRCRQCQGSLGTDLSVTPVSAAYLELRQ